MFASGLSEKVGSFLSQQHILKNSNSLDRAFLGFLRENEMFSQDLFRKLPRIEDLSVNTTQINLSKAEMYSLSRAVHSRLKNLELTLGKRSEMKDFLWGTDHSGFSSLESVTLTGALLKDVQSLNEVVKAGRLPQLRKLDMKGNPLTGQLRSLFGGKNSPKFPKLEELNLKNTQLNKDDMQSLGDTVAAGKLPLIKALDLRDNVLSGSIRNLLGSTNHPGFPKLEKLNLQNTHLHQEDVSSLRVSTGNGKLPQLKGLDLRDNNLTGNLKNLLGGADHPGFPCLERLEPWTLSNTLWTWVDAQSLSEAIGAGKLPQLELNQLDLRNNKLTGCLQNFLGDSEHAGFLGLGELNLSYTSLNQEDMARLVEAIRAAKLPQLWQLDLGDNDLSHMENEVEDLVAACDVHCREQIYLNLCGTGLGTEFKRMCEDTYHNVNLNIPEADLREDDLTDE